MIEKTPYFYRARCDNCGAHIGAEYRLVTLLVYLEKFGMNYLGMILCPKCKRRQIKSD